MRIWIYVFFASAMAATPQGGGGCDPCPTKSCDPGPGDTDGQGDAVDDPAVSNFEQAVSLDHSWLFGDPLLGSVEFEHHESDDVLLLLDVRLERGASAFIKDDWTSKWTGWAVGTEVEVVGVYGLAAEKVLLDGRGEGTLTAGYPMELRLVVTEPGMRSIESSYLMKLPLDVPLAFDGRTVAFEELNDGWGGLFTLR